MSRKCKSNHYTKLARYYDAIYTKIIDYEKQASYIENIFQTFHTEKVKTILDAGCGTGNFTFIFAKRGYEVTGIDISEDMIRVAKGKMKNLPKRSTPQFIEMHMRDIRLKDKYDAITLLFGGFGYLLKQADVLKFFASAREHLPTGGLLVFEFWQSSAVRSESSSENGLRTFVKVQSGEQLVLRLDTSKFDKTKHLLNIDFEFFVFNTKEKTLNDMFCEEHLLKTYSIEEMKRLLPLGGFEVIRFLDGHHIEDIGQVAEATTTTFRVLAVATPKN